MTTTQLTLGNCITSAIDGLTLISPQDLFTRLTADPALKAMTERLCKLCQLDREAAKAVKTRLPYVVGSTFGPDEAGFVRRTTGQLEAAGYFIIDIDHYDEHLTVVPESIQNDEYVMLAFISPGGQGIKILYRLLEPCTNPQLFSAAYRQFATETGTRHRLTRSLDLRTSDSARACFLAHDPNAYFNPDAMPVDWRLWLPDDRSFPILAEPAEHTAVTAPKPIKEDAYREILKQINPRTPPAAKRPKQVFIPEEMLPVQEDVRRLCQQLNWELNAIEPLNYGLKFCVRQGYRTAEVNAFYGKKGFSIVRSPKTGTDPALSDILYEKLRGLLMPEPIVHQVPFADVLTLN